MRGQLRLNTIRDFVGDMACQFGADVVRFAQRIIRIPSPSGDEQQCVEAIRDEMYQLGYDDVQIDGAGNVVGLVLGSHADLPPILLNCHADHVDVGDPSNWSRNPYGADLIGDIVYGRGASDTKGAIAVQVYAPALLRMVGKRPKQDVYVAAVVHEETSGFGTRWLFEKGGLPDFGLVILGEATSNELCIGHRGRAEFCVRIEGRSAHASAPELGNNPNFELARFLLELEKAAADMAHHQVLGSSTIAPTLIYNSSPNRNVISDWCEAIIDWRFTTETQEEMVHCLSKLLQTAGVDGGVELTKNDILCWTGVRDQCIRLSPSYALDPNDPIVRRVSEILAMIRGKQTHVGTWRFGTDGGYVTSTIGIPTIGFSPCEEQYAHTVEDCVRVSMMAESLRCYLALLMTGLDARTVDEP
jgi:succinyl-diaminopimelate desuccinylase